MSKNKSSDPENNGDEVVNPGPKKSGWKETVQTIVYAVLIAVFVRTVAYVPFNIPSGSMLPTLLVGDYLFVSKFSYGYSRFSLPFGLPLFEGRIFESKVTRGDVAVFKYPRDTKTDYIKRIIGLPGDRVQLRGGVLYINDQAVERHRMDDFLQTDQAGNVSRIPRYRETLPSGVSYETLDLIENGHGDNTPVFLVPEGHYFALGDNRDNSLDSRFANGVGYIPAVNLVGRAEVLFFSTDGSAKLWQPWKWFSAMRTERIFESIE